MTHGEGVLRRPEHQHVIEDVARQVIKEAHGKRSRVMGEWAGRCAGIIR
jgi:hypothetical protein